MKTAVVLAAGLGTKIWPYNDTRAKGNIPVCDKPLVRVLVEDLFGLGIKRVKVVTGYLGDQVRHALMGLDNVEFLESDPKAGTAHALASALGDLNEPVLAAYGDILADMADIKALMATMDQTPLPIASALGVGLGREKAGDWICCDMDSGGRLRGIGGHPRGGGMRLCGLFAFAPGAFDFIRNSTSLYDEVGVGDMPRIEADLSQTLADMIKAGKTVAGVSAKGPFVDLDKPWHIMEANQAYLRRLIDSAPERQIDPTAEVAQDLSIGGKLIVGPGARIGPRVTIQGSAIIGAGAVVENGPTIKGDVFVGDQARVHNYCEIYGGAVVGRKSLVGHAAEVNGVFFTGVLAYHYCELSGVFGAHTDIGAATVCATLRFDDRTPTHTTYGRRENPPRGGDETYIGDYCRTGVNVITMPGVKIGAYCCVGAGTIVYEDIPSNTLVIPKQELVFKKWGPEKYGW